MFATTIDTSDPHKSVVLVTYYCSSYGFVRTPDSFVLEQLPVKQLKSLCLQRVLEVEEIAVQKVSKEKDVDLQSSIY